MDMNKYHNGKIYKIVDNGYNKQYIGSTTESLSQRMTRHRSDYKRYTGEDRQKSTSAFSLFNEFGVENCKIELIEYCKSNTKDELLKREGEIIKASDCVNKQIAGRTKEQWYEDNKAHVVEHSKEYRDKNRDKLKEYLNNYYQENKEKFQEYRRNHREQKKSHDDKYRERNKGVKIKCVCGSDVAKAHISCHKKTRKHQEYLKSLENQDD